MTKKNKSAVQGKNRRLRKIFRWFWGIVIAGMLGVAALFTLVGLFGHIPSFEELENPNSNLATEIISSDGVVLATFHIENRSFVSYDELSPYLIDALVATEDKRFYTHAGIDFFSLGRVAVKTLLFRDKSSGGGSTISQQLALNLFSQREQNKLKRAWQKLEEWMTAVKIERNYTKEEIIAMYFNTVFYGSNAYGIRSAASTFFGKHPSQLTREEAAMLVGVVNAPTMYSPVRNPDRAWTRRNHVLAQMVKCGDLTEQEGDSLKRLPVTLNYQPQDHLSGQAPYFRDMLRRLMNRQQPERKRYGKRLLDYRNDSLAWVEDPLYGWLHKNLKPDGSRYDLDRDGLRIYTTINSRMQRYAEEAVAEHLRYDLQPAFSAELKYRRNFPFSNNLTREEVNLIIRQGILTSDRYREMKAAGQSDKEIEAAFKKKTPMTVFSWQRGAIDTVMTPHDSILYYKSLLRVSFMAMEPQTGFVRAYVGGPHYRYFKYDNVRQSRRQVGSTMKPFLYTLAMQQGMNPCDRVLNVSQTFIVGDSTWSPKSTDRPEWIGKMVTLKWGLTKSSNNISAYLMKQFGPQALINISHKMGIKSDLPWAPSLCLGSCDLSLFELVSAYNTFPSKGVHIEPFFVTRIEDKSSNKLTAFIPKQTEALSDRAAYLTVNLMQAVVNEGTAYRLRSRYVPEGQIAGKTGTTNDQADGWFVGFMPKLTAGVWVGAEDRSVHFESLALGGGANMALPIWGIFMKKVLADGQLGIDPADEFAIPPGVPQAYACDGSDADGGQATEKIEGDNFF
jgi:penicillin-binding protein 1A